MNRIAALALVGIVPMTACLGPSRAPGRIAGAIVTGAGFVMVAEATTTDCSGGAFGDALSCAIGTGLDTAMGAALLSIGLSALLYNELRTVPVEPVEQPLPQLTERRYVANAADIGEPTTADPMLRQLTLQASIAARAGHCEAVRIVADRVDDLDPRYRRGGFVTDDAISACIAR